MQFALAEVVFEDHRYEYGGEEWPKVKSQYPFGTLPVLEVAGKQLSQSFVIARYLGRKFGFAGKTEWDEAQVDALADQYKDYWNDIKPYLLVWYGAEQGDAQFALAEVVFEDHRYEYGGEEWPKVKFQYPFGTLPVLEVDGKQLSQSFAIARDLGRKFGFAGKTEWDEAQVDALADQYKDYWNDLKPYLLVWYGAEQGDAEKLKKDVFEPAIEKHYKVFTNALKAAGHGFLVGDSVTYIDLALAENLDFFASCDLIKLDNYPELKAHVAKVHSIPAIAKWRANRPKTMF